MHTLLIHGGSHGAWCWDAVLGELAGAGVSASAFDLPGAGADPTPRAGLGIAQSVARVIREVDAAPSGPIRLVAHSIAGMLVPDVLAARGHRIGDVVLLAAVILEPGERGIDMIPQDRRGSYYAMAAASPDNTLMPGFDSVRSRFFTQLTHEAAVAAFRRLTPQPFGPYLERAQAGFGTGSACPVRYLAPDGDRNFDTLLSASFAAKAGVRPVAIPGDHCAMLSRPRELAGAIRLDS